MKEKITQIIKDVSDQHPYKKVGDPDSYSEYNEGWSDVCDVIEQRLIEEIVHPDPEPECQFESDTLTSSATICKHCGKEKHEHSYVSKICQGIICHFAPLISQSSEKPSAEEWLKENYPTLTEWLKDPDAIAGMYDMIIKAMNQYSNKNECPTGVTITRKGYCRKRLWFVSMGNG